MPRIDTFLVQLLNAKGSDLHLSGAAQPMVRVQGLMDTIGDRALPAEEVEAQIREIMPADAKETFDRTFDVDFAYETPGLGRFRVNVFMDRNGTAAVFRHVPSDIPTLDDLQLPPVLETLSHLKQGLVLVTGPTGSGKSTTLAALVNEINTQRRAHIITVEDPIEFVHLNGQSLVNQREVGRHTQTFNSALRAALREDPDVILLGEMRDLETTALAIEAAETGHLVLGTLHTSSAASTVDRIVDQFPSDQQAQVRTMLAGSLKGIAAQCLPRRKDGSGRVAALEILVANAAISSLIRDGKTHQIPTAIQTGGRLGMITLNDCLVKLACKGVIEPEEAFLHSHDQETLVRALQVAGVPSARSGATGRGRRAELQLSGVSRRAR